MKSITFSALRLEGDRLIAAGWGLIDTSGRTRNHSIRNTVALASKALQYTVTLSATAKMEIYKKHQKCYSIEELPLQLHARTIALCLEDNLDLMQGVFICADGFVPGELKNRLHILLGEKYNLDKIIVLRSLKPKFGKHNIADRLALKVNKKIELPTKMMSEELFGSFNRKV